MAENNDLFTGYVMGQSEGNNNGMFGGDGLWGLIIILALLSGGFGFGGFGGGGMGMMLPWMMMGGFGGFGGCGRDCATVSDLASGFNNSAVLNSLNDIKMGQAQAINYNNQGFAGLNSTVQQGFHGVDNAICNLGFNTQQGFNNIGTRIDTCCCETKGAIKDVGIGIERTGWNLSKQISDCCCDIEKMNMQSRFDAQGYNCNTLQAIDKLGDRIIGYMSKQETEKLRDELQTYRLAASQANQNNVLMAAMDANKAEILRRTGSECPSAAYIVNPPTPVTFRQGCGCGNGGYTYGQAGFAA